MLSKAITTFIVLTLVNGAFTSAAGETLLFSDSFQGTTLSPEWEVHEGNWEVVDGALTVRDGGTISLKKLPGGCFAMEFEIAFPSHWMCVIPMFTGPDDYATLYLGGGYWESFQMFGDELEDFVQHVDSEIVRTGDFQKMKVVSEYGSVMFFYDGKEKGPASFPFRPGARVGFRSLPGSGLLRIRNFRLTSVKPPEAKVVDEMQPEKISKGTIWKDRGIEGKPGATPDLLSVEAGTGAGALTYAFAGDMQFESHFVRIPAGAQAGSRIMLELEADNSQNSFFVIVHDASGEQHLVMKSSLTWQGWQDMSIDLTRFLKSPPNLERLAIHWGGDANQTIDFPITAIDIGIVKRVPTTTPSGLVRFRNVRFVE